jgi:hypothetical protein
LRKVEQLPQPNNRNFYLNCLAADATVPRVYGKANRKDAPGPLGGGTIGLMALNKLTPPVAPVAAAASHKERLATPTKPTTVAQKDAQPSQKRKVAHVVRKHKEVATYG